MNRLTKTFLYAYVAAAALIVGAGQSFAAEPGDFEATLRGASIGIPLGGAPPPGLYGSVENFIGPNGTGVGQNSQTNGAGTGGRGITVFGEAIAPALIWGTGWKILGADVTFAAIEPLFTVGGLTNLCAPTLTGVPAQASCVGTEPLAFGGGAGAFFENVHNTVVTGALSWDLKNGWHVSAGLAGNIPDGSTYNGTLAPDYWTISPTFAAAYFSKDWVITANFQYDINGPSQGHTGSYAAIQANVPSASLPIPAALVTSPNGCVGFNCPGIGYRTGDEAYLDWAIEYKGLIKNVAIGPAGYFKWQPGNDSPGQGWTCAGLAASPVYGTTGLTCGKAQDFALGGIISYNTGGTDLELIVTDSVGDTEDNFKGVSIFTRVNFKLWGPEAPAPAPIIGKAK
jgi:hypothetical protein